MAVEEETEGSLDDPRVKLLAQLKTSKILLAISAVISIVIVSIMATGMVVMFMRIDSLKPPTEAEILTRFDELSEELLRLNDFRRKELLLIVELRAEMDAIRKDDSAEVIGKISGALSQREADFQQLLETTISGTTDLARMIQGKRDWTKQHQQKLQDLLAASKERQLTFSGLGPASGGN